MEEESKCFHCGKKVNPNSKNIVKQRYINCNRTFYYCSDCANLFFKTIVCQVCGHRHRVKKDLKWKYLECANCEKKILV